MAKKLLIIIATAEKEKAVAGLLYAANAMRHHWVDDVKVCFFGPFETLLANDPDVQGWVAEIQEHQVPTACKFIADQAGVSEKLVDLGLEVVYVGQPVSDYINDDYVPLVF